MGKVRNRFWVRSDRRDVPAGAPLDLSNERNKLPKCYGIQVRLVLSPYIPVQGSLCIQANKNGPDLDREISRDSNKICKIFKIYLINS